jgi:signal transduction histidine kinase
MKRQWRIWLAFALALAVALGGMAWVSVAALRLDRGEAEARRQAALEENIRLALWRMDSALTPIIARESGHPYFAYTAFHPAERAYTRMFAEIRRGEVLVPSPLLVSSSPHVRLYFQFEPDGDLTSPQVPAGNMRDLAEAGGYASGEQLEQAAGRLAELRAVTSAQSLLAALPRARPRSEVAFRYGHGLPDEPQGQMTPQEVAPSLQQKRASVEARARGQRAQQAYSSNVEAQSPSQVQAGAKNEAPPDVLEGVMQPVWVGNALLLARRASVGGREYVQGCWLDWRGIQEELLKEIGDLLPDAALEPVAANGEPGSARMLATLPVRLVTGAEPSPLARGWSPIRVALLIAWACVVVAAVAVGGLLVGAVRLSERRGDFVSAVTHELRTPLTTFRMYAEMLAEGMVPDEAKRQQYLTTLRTEADRLSHLVENVLAYARLERGRARGQREAVGLSALLDRVVPRLRERVGRAGRELDVAVCGDAAARSVLADPSVVEQVLLNLVDNACKYAASVADGRIHLEAAFGVPPSGGLVLRVRDHGPGVLPDDRRKLFRSFSKSARQAAHTAPGVGLGLALSRRLARDMGGDLRLDDRVTDGACFALELPLARA